MPLWSSVYATGSVANPMSDHQLHRKAVALAEPALGEDGAERLLAALERRDPPVGAAEIVELALPAAARVAS